MRLETPGEVRRDEKARLSGLRFEIPITWFTGRIRSRKRVILKLSDRLVQQLIK